MHGETGPEGKGIPGSKVNRIWLKFLLSRCGYRRAKLVKMEIPLCLCSRVTEAYQDHQDLRVHLALDFTDRRSAFSSFHTVHLCSCFSPVQLGLDIQGSVGQPGPPGPTGPPGESIQGPKVDSKALE